MDIPHRTTKDGIIIEVKVDPRSSRREIVGVIGSALKVKLTSPPVEGAANEELIAVLAEHFGIRKRDIRIIRGASSRLKIVALKGVVL
jgi:uncharacterized protein (TIGR00251 family)